jgi:hypothetical protein
MFQTKVTEKIKTKILCPEHFFRKSCRIWDNVEPTDENIIRRTRFACWIIKAKNTHSEYVILITFARQQWLGKSASFLRCTYIASLVWNVNVSSRTVKFLNHNVSTSRTWVSTSNSEPANLVKFHVFFLVSRSSDYLWRVHDYFPPTAQLGKIAVTWRL